MKTKRRIAALLVTLLCVASLPTHAIDDTYDFSIMGVDGSQYRIRDINYFGEVLFRGPGLLDGTGLTDGQSTYYFPGGSETGGNYRTPVGFGGLNDNGQIIQDEVDGNQSKIRTLVTSEFGITSTFDVADYPEFAAQCLFAAMNNAAEVACLTEDLELFFLREGSAPLLIGDANSDIAIANYFPLINNLSQVVFLGSEENEAYSGFYVWDEGVIKQYAGRLRPESQVQQPANLAGFFPPVPFEARTYAFNDEGVIAFPASADGGAQNLYVADGESVAILVEGAAFGNDIFNVSMNNVGDIAFLSGGGIYTGPDPVADLLIEVGDEVDGRIVSQFGSPLINDLGQVAFLVNFDTTDFRARNNIIRADPIPQFADVPLEHWARLFVQNLVVNGITGGCGNGNYCPNDPVTRAQMAVFLERGIRGSDFLFPPATGNVFDDVGRTDFAAAYIEQLAIDGITAGCGNNSFCPNAEVTRAQMAVFLLRAKYGSTYSPPPATGIFLDAPLGSFAVDWIEQLAAEGITAGCGNGNYCPRDPVTRAQMAVFLVRTFGL